eukprot:7459352-Ditylum_brightwellii.AAC.1
MQGFDQVDQGLQKFVEFCTHLESCEPSANKPKDKKSPRSRNTGKHKADTSTKPTALCEARKSGLDAKRCRESDLQGSRHVH